MGRSVFFVCKECKIAEWRAEADVLPHIEEHRGHMFFILHPCSGEEGFEREMKILLGWEE